MDEPRTFSHRLFATLVEVHLLLLLLFSEKLDDSHMAKRFILNEPLAHVHTRQEFPIREVKIGLEIVAHIKT